MHKSTALRYIFFWKTKSIYNEEVYFETDDYFSRQSNTHSWDKNSFYDQMLHYVLFWFSKCVKIIGRTPCFIAQKMITENICTAIYIHTLLYWTFDNLDLSFKHWLGTLKKLLESNLELKKCFRRSALNLCN